MSIKFFAIIFIILLLIIVGFLIYSFRSKGKDKTQSIFHNISDVFHNNKKNHNNNNYHSNKAQNDQIMDHDQGYYIWQNFYPLLDLKYNLQYHPYS